MCIYNICMCINIYMNMYVYICSCLCMCVNVYVASIFTTFFPQKFPELTKVHTPVHPVICVF